MCEQHKHGSVGAGTGNRPGYPSLMSLYFGSFSVSITSIQAFWSVAFAVTEKIAISPLLPMGLAIDSTSFLPTSAVVTWLMNTLRRVWRRVVSGELSQLVLARQTTATVERSAMLPA